MPCLGEKFAVGGAAAGVVASGVIVVVGAPTVIVGTGGIVALVGALSGMVAALLFLETCLRNQGKETAAENVRRKMAALQADLDRLRALVEGMIPGDEGF